MRKAGGNWVDGDRFFDRAVEVEALSERIRDGAHTLLTAQRRMGKTSLVRETLRRLSAAEQITPLFVDLEDARDPQDAIAEIATQTTTAHGLWIRIRRGFANTLQQAGGYLEEVGVGEIKAKLRGGIDRGTWKQKGTDLFGTLDQHEKPVVLAIDELSILVNRLLKGHDYLLTPERIQAADEFLGWLRRMAQEHRNVRLVISGSISLEPILRQAGLSAHANVFSRFELEPWSEATASACIAELAAGYAVDIPADVRSAMCRMLRCCVPHHVQQFFDCLHEDLRRDRRRSATLTDAERVYSSDMLGIRGQIDLEHYETRLRLVLGDRAHLAATELLTEAAVCNGVLTEQSIAQYEAYSRMPDDDGVVIADVLRVLEHDGYLVSDARGFRFVSRLIEDWWRARYARNFTRFADRRPRGEP